jgi:hypothetical protein
MAIIPGGQQIRTNSADVDLTNRGNALVQKQNQVYTMNDIIETVNAGGGASAYNEAVFYFRKGLSSWNVKELYNDTGLTFTWSIPNFYNPNTYKIHADVTGGALNDLNNDIYAWGTINSPTNYNGQSVGLPGVFLQKYAVDISQTVLQADGSGLGNASTFANIIIIRRMIVTNPIEFGS